MRSLIFLYFFIHILTGCAENRCNGKTDSGRCVGNAMEYCNDEDVHTSRHYWEPFFDCEEYGLMCQDNFYHGRSFDLYPANTHLHCVDTTAICLSDEMHVCSKNSAYLLDCTKNVDGQIYGVLAEIPEDASFCWKSDVDGISRYVYAKGACVENSKMCVENNLVHCVGGYWTQAESCLIMDAKCVSTHSNSECQ